MIIKNRKIREVREVGNSVIVTLSRESLLEKGLKTGDTISGWIWWVKRGNNIYINKEFSKDRF